MSESNGIAKLAGRVGMLFVLVGVALFMLGIFGAPRVLAFTGIGLMAFSLVAFFIEEQGNRKQSS